MNALEFNYWMKLHWKKVVLALVGVAILGLTLFQIMYPASRMLPGAKVDGLALGWMSKNDAAAELDKAYGDLELKVYFGKNEAPFQAPKMKEVGIAVNNEARLEAMNFPFLMRFVPGSFWFAGGMAQPGELEYEYDMAKIESYTQSKVGDTCSIPTRDATLKLIDSQLQVAPSVPGGDCDITEFQQQLAKVKPTPYEENKVTVAITERPAKVDDDKARALADMLNNRLKSPMPMTVDTETQNVPGRAVMAWLDFKSDVPPESIDTSADLTARLVFEINKTRMEEYLNRNVASKLVKAPGVTKITTLDFKETARTDGPGGRAIDIDKAAVSVDAYINRRADKAVAATRDVGPKMEYTRNYTPTTVGFNALLAQFDQDNPGEYGIAFTEISGFRYLRRAVHQGDKKFLSGGAEGMYIAYAVLKEQKAGVIRPVEKIAGSKEVEECMDDMIEKSDTACREGFYKLMGHATTTARSKELGVTGTTFAGNKSTTTTNDLHKVTVGLQLNQIGRDIGAQSILNTMRTTLAKDGIPAGISKGRTAHIVGETGTTFVDTGAVYSAARGDYVLTVMTDGGSWEAIAELVKKIQALREVKMGANDR